MRTSPRARTLLPALAALLLGPALARADDAAPLVARLDDADPARRAEGARALGALGRTAAATAIPRLVDRLQDPSEAVRRAAAAALGRMGPAAGPPLVRALADPSARAQRAAAEALRALGPDLDEAGQDLLVAAIEGGGVHWPLLEVLADLGPAAGPRAVLTLARYEQLDHGRVSVARVGPGAVPALRAALQDDDAETRGAAARGLAALGPDARDALDDLARAVADPERQVAALAAQALARLGAWDALARLAAGRPAPVIAALAQAGEPALATLDRVYREGDEEVRRRVVSALGGLNVGRGWIPAGATTTLAAAAQEVEPELRTRALGALGGCGLSALGPLTAALESPDPATRVAAMDALAHAALVDAKASVVGPTRSTAPERHVPRPVPGDTTRLLVGALASPDARERAAALGALGALGDRAALGEVARRIEDPAPAVRAAAVAACALLGDEAPAAALVAPALRDPDPEVARAAADALIDLGGDARVHLAPALEAEAPEARAAALAWLDGWFRAEGALPVPAARLLPLLRDPDRGVREGAAEHLARLEPVEGPAREALEAALRDPDAGVASCAGRGLVRGDAGALLAALRADEDRRHQPISLLRRSRDPAVGRAVLELLESDDDELRWAALELVDARHAAALPALRRALRGDACEAALDALARLGPAAAPALDDIRALLALPEAATCLAAIGPAAAPAAPELAQLLGAARESQALTVYGTLGAIGREAGPALPRMLDALPTIGTFGPHNGLAPIAAIVSAGGGDEAAVARVVDALVRAADSTESFMPEAAYLALAASGPRARAAGPFLLDAALDPWVRVEHRLLAMDALLAVDPAARDALERGLLRGLADAEGGPGAAALLARRWPRHAEAAALALGRALATGDARWSDTDEQALALAEAGAPGEAQLVRALVRDWPPEAVAERVELRRAAAEALGLVAAPGAATVGALVDALTDTDRAVRWAALASIGAVAQRPGGDDLVAPFAAVLGAALLGPPEPPWGARREQGDLGPRAWGARRPLEALGPRAAPALPALLQALERRSSRLDALEVLARLGPAGRPALPRLLDLARAEGAGALGAARAVLGCDPPGPAAAEARALLRRALPDLRGRDAVAVALALGRRGEAWEEGDLARAREALGHEAETGDRLEARAAAAGLLALGRRDLVVALRDDPWLPVEQREAARAALEGRAEE